MGGLLACQAVDEEAAIRAYTHAKRWIEKGKGLPTIGQVDAPARVAKFGRLNGAASPLVTSSRGWLATVGSWHHPDAARADDTAWLLGQLEERGTEALDGMDGMYAAVWYDSRESALTAATDLFGRLHLFYAESPAGVYLSTSSIACAVAVPGEADPVALYEFLAAGTNFEDRTPFARVRRLGAGRIFRFREGRLIESSPQHLLPRGGPSGARGDKLIDGVLDSFEQGFPRVLSERERPLADLTGGVDSRLVVGLLEQAGRRFDVTVSGDSGEADVRVALELAGRLGLELVQEPRRVMEEARSSFDAAVGAARRCEGSYDAAEYASIEAVHSGHAKRWDVSLNGSGGEVYRNYWWGRSSWDRTDLDPVPAAARRFHRQAIQPGFLLPEFRRDERTHFHDVVSRSLEARTGDPFHAQLDHVYLDLRMQCWQGSIASATNEIWPNISPLLWGGPLRVLFSADPRQRLAGRFICRMLARFSTPHSSTKLASGLPPGPSSALSVWRHLPALWIVPSQFARRAKWRIFPSMGQDVREKESVRRLLATGARDYLAPSEMLLQPFLDRSQFEAYLDRGLADGAVPLAVLGRLIAVEFACRSARAGGTAL